jgi:hypothetical protein
MLIAKIGIRLHGFDFNFTVLIRIGQEKRRRNQQSIGSDPENGKILTISND